MGSVEAKSFNDLVRLYLGRSLPDSLADLIHFSELPPDARGVASRFLELMKRSSCPATEINRMMIWLLATVTPHMLPSAWDGLIPPLTAPRRHRKLDGWVLHHPWSEGQGRPVFIDLGCGFPPATTIDTAKTLPEWLVFGVDRSFAPYVVYDAEGQYACFDGDGTFQYFQSPAKPLDHTPEEVRTRFQRVFSELLPGLQSSDNARSETVQNRGFKLISNHIKDFELENLEFVKADIEETRLPPARFVRCMNVLLYFQKDVRRKMLASLGQLLDDEGLLVVGFNHPFGIYARYALYEKKAGRLRARAFAFSLDNLRPLGIGPWLTIAEEDHEAELLADLTRTIRRDQEFWPEFNQYVDELREGMGICGRNDDGFFVFSEDDGTASIQMIMEKTAALWNQVEAAGYSHGAVQALRRAGYDAWINSVGDIAVFPPEGSLLWG